MLHMILGRAGCGKTATVMQEIKDILNERRKKVFLVVPEQQLFSVERGLLPTLPSDQVEYLTLTSFTKLCDTLEELYGGKSHMSLTKASSALLMWLNLRQIKGLLETYASVPSGDVSLTRMMLETAKELSNNGVTAEALEALSEKLDPEAPLRGKLKDIALVSASYHRLVEEMCGSDPADRLLRGCQTAEKTNFFHGADIYVDAFSSFTAQEYAMLSVMMSQADSTTVTLCIDDPFTTLPHFVSIKDTYQRLNRMARDLSVERRVTKLRVADKNDEFSILEASLWDFSSLPVTTPPVEADKIRLITASNPYEEAEAGALHVLELCQKGSSFEEIAVVVRDLDSWKGILDVAFEQYRIPFYMSEKSDLNSKPAARLLLLALRCISRHYQIGDVISLCKTGLCAVSPSDLDAFEEYTDTWHLSGNRLTEPVWSMNPDGYTTDWSQRGKRILESANLVRQKVMTPLLALEVKLKSSENLTEQSKALYEYLCDLSIKNQLADRGQTHLELGQVREAGETVRLWSFLNEALSTIVSVSSVLQTQIAALSPEELSSILSLIYAETDIGSVPARHDCVMIGSADTLRVDKIKASLLLGLCEGEFPKLQKGKGLFSEQDRSLLSEYGIDLTSREEYTTSEELLYVYRAMTTPSEMLYLSRSLAGTDGRELSPSVAFTRVQYLFPYISVIPFSSRYLKSNETFSVYRPSLQDELPEERTYALLGEEMWLSRSKLLRYAGCPYSYYGSYILKLRERMNARVDNHISGLFLHHVLEIFLKRSLDDDGKIIPLSEEDLEVMTDEIIMEYLSSINHDPELYRQGRFLHIFERLRTISLVLIKDLISELRQSQFIPVGLEWDTHGFSPDDPSPLVLPLYEVDDGEDLPVGIRKGAPVRLKMGGVIDRVDVYRTEDGKKAFIRVVDYKSSKHELNESTLTKDMDVQLLLYLFTLCSEENRRLFANEDGSLPEVVLPAQAMYLSPNEDSDSGEISPVRTGILLDEEQVLRAVSTAPDSGYFPLGVKADKDGVLTGRSLYSAERIAELECLLYELIREQAQAMYSGNAHRTPSSDACKFCKLREGCPVAVPPSKF